MDIWQERTARLIGEEAVKKINRARVAVFGLGGVGSYAAEALVRAGVGTLLYVDGDQVDITNINRQLIATAKNVGLEKAQCAKARALEINPNAAIDARCLFYCAETADEIDLSMYDCVADCIDSVSSKLLLIERAKAAGAYVVSCMGAGNKLDPTRFRVADIEKTEVCPLARVMRRELKKRSIGNVRCVYSDELPYKPADGERAPSSISFVPSVAGLILAGDILRHIIENR